MTIYTGLIELTYILQWNQQMQAHVEDVHLRAVARRAVDMARREQAAARRALATVHDPALAKRLRQTARRVGGFRNV